MSFAPRQALSSEIYSWYPLLKELCCVPDPVWTRFSYQHSNPDPAVAHSLCSLSQPAPGFNIKWTHSPLHLRSLFKLLLRLMNAGLPHSSVFHLRFPWRPPSLLTTQGIMSDRDKINLSSYVSLVCLFPCNCATSFCPLKLTPSNYTTVHISEGWKGCGGVR